ncbi:MAG TPA: hypothetical protein VFW96_09430 [Thermomicrobiales bacterium]|nr:hypothetical protein [Thermomicrobiales bacterium]
MTWTEPLPTQRQLWGLQPRAVADWAAARERDHEREVADLRAHLADLERRQARAQADLAARDGEFARVAARLDDAVERASNLEAAAERARRGAVHDRVLREEAVRIVADAWAEAQAIRQRARRLAERTQARLRAEIARTRLGIRRERDQWEGEIAQLQARRALAVADLEATARDLLAQAARFKEVPTAPEAPPETPPEPPAATPTPPADAARPGAAVAPPCAEAPDGEAPADPHLRRALDDLEALLDTRRAPDERG